MEERDWLMTNTDDIISQSLSLFTGSREKNRRIENTVHDRWNFLADEFMETI
jgi:hypothetical protein